MSTQESFDNSDNAAGLPPLALIAGPTASGKSDVAVQLALALRERGREGVVINADSAQVYADLAVLSARPSAEETAGIAPQVEDQSLHTLCLEVVQGGDELVVRGDGELGEFDVADAVGQHEGRFEAFDRNGAARHFDLDWFCDSLPFER